MVNPKCMTKKQHYIPQVYLRGFSPEYEDSKEIENSKHTIYCYDLIKNIQFPHPIPIKSICYEDYLYEVTDSNEEIVLPNYLEIVLGSLEKMFSKYRKMLEQKAFLPENYKTKCFLKKEEKAFWVTYMVIQILRMPDTIKEAEEFTLKFWKDKFSRNQAKNFAREFCLPFFKEIKGDSREAMLVEAFAKPMMSMYFAIGVDMQGRIITGDKPVYIHSKSFPCEEYDIVIFPITSRICLFLLGGKEKNPYYKNRLFPMNDEVLEMITKSITEAAHEKLYSNHLLNDKELCQIHEVMRDKEGGN